MKFLVYLSLFFLVISCAIRQPLTAEMKKEYNLDTPDAMKKVQFYTSSAIVLERVVTNGEKAKTDDGTLVTSKRKEENRVIIPSLTKCIFENYEANGDIIVRFEVGAGRVIKFGIREGQSNERYYFVAKWDYDKGAEVSYGNEIYYATSNSANACLLVSIKKLQKTRRKDRIVKGLKV
jgi:hypothetical protein